MARPAPLTVTMRPQLLSDAAWLETWLPAVAAAVGAEGEGTLRATRLPQHCAARIIEVGGVPAGLVAFRINWPAAAVAAFIGVALEPAHARKGHGMAAALLAEREMADAGARDIYARASASHGISMYFWIRLGYAPVSRADWPSQQEGMVWLRRRLTAPP